MSELVREIVEITAFVTGDDEQPQLTVEAEGLAPTGGWTNVRLEAHIYIDAPEDGFQDFDLVGDRPSETSADVLTPVEAAWEGPLEDWVLGVRVHAIDNMIEEDLFEYEDEDEEGEEDEAA
jgi:hypothetical protein